MAMKPAGLADDIKVALGHGDKPTSEQTKGMAKAIIDEITLLGVVVFLPTTVMGTAPSSGGPLSQGEASGGKIVGIAGATLAAKLALGIGQGAPSPQLLSFAGGICTHILTSGQVIFEKGKITGVCSNSPTSPGVLTGQGEGGKIVGLSGSGMAALCAAAFGGKVSEELKKKCTAICNHIMENAEVKFAMGTVVGVCSAAGGPVTLGAATLGRVS